MEEQIKAEIDRFANDQEKKGDLTAIIERLDHFDLVKEQVIKTI